MTDRKLNQWVAIAEIVSAVAVVFSLIYVGFEIRQTTKESDADIQAELLTYTVQRRNLVIESSDLSSILVRGYQDPDSLTPDEALRFQYYIELFYVAWERAYFASEEGVFSTELFALWDEWFTSVANNDPAFVWPRVRDSQRWHRSFTEHVDRALGLPLSETEPPENSALPD